MQSMMESGALRMGKNLWAAKTAYIENSPIMHADKISTPLLLMANTLDPVVPVSQALALFTSLRRLGKPAHLLQYEGEGHTLVGEEAMRDYTLKMTEFFDFYLKGKGKPRWIVEADL
jgi:dipeptidyl aminopeptidase/acylaminoacyl peptidase